MKLDEMLQRTNHHVAILGAFNMDPTQPKVLRGSASEVLDQLKFSLMSERVLRRRNGNIDFYSYAVFSPAELKGLIADGKALDIGKMQVLPDGDGVLARYLADTSQGQESAIGAALLAALLDAADGVRAFDHPAFGVQLTEGLYYAWDSRGLPPEIVDAYTLRNILYHPAFNLALLDFLRAGARQHESGTLLAALLEGARKALTDQVPSVTGQAKERLAEAFANETAAYRDWLVMPAASAKTEAALQHFAVLEERHGHGAEFQAVRSAYPIPEHHQGGLREVYGLFRATHDQVADLAQCEPLMAFISQWYLESFSQNRGGAALAKAIFEAIYKGNDAARPSKIPQRIKREAAAGHARALQALLDHPSNKPQDVMAREIAQAALEAYLKVRRPQAAFERKELIGLMRDELMSLSMKLFPGRDAVEISNLKLVEAFRKAERDVERCFDVEGGSQAAEMLRAKMAPVFATLRTEVADVAGEDEGARAEGILDVVLSAAGETAQPAAIAEELVLALGPAEGVAEAALINSFRETEGGKINEAGNALREAYEQLLSTPAGLKVAGSLGAVDDPDMPAEDAREAKVIAEIARLVLAGSDEVKVKPADDLEAEEMGATADASAGVDTTGIADAGDRDDPDGDATGADNTDDVGQTPLVANDGDQGADKPRRSPVPISLPLTAEERAMLFRDAVKTTLNEGSRGKAPAVRRWAEALVDARDRVMQAKGEIVSDPRIVSEHDATGKQLAAGSRFLTLGEFFLAASSANAPIGKAHTSFNAMITLYLMRHTGREYGRGARGLLRDWKQKGADPNDLAAKPDSATSDIRKVPLWQICPASFDTEGLNDRQIAAKFQQVAQQEISGFISEVRAQTAALSRLSGFYRDVEEVKALLRLLNAAGDCQVTVVNTIASDYPATNQAGDYPAGGALFNGRKYAIDDTPPGTVFVSAQAFPPGAARNLDILAAPLGLDSGASGEEPLKETLDSANSASSWLRTNTHPGVFGVPVLIGRGIQSGVLPVVGYDVPGLPALVALLTGRRVEGLKPFREAWGMHTHGLGLPFEISSADSVLKGLGMILRAPGVHGPIITARVLTALAHQRQFGPLDKSSRTLARPGDFDPTDKAPSLVQAVDAALAALRPLAGYMGGKDLGTLVFMQSNDRWETRRDRQEATGEPKDWIAFAPPPKPGASVEPSNIFTRL